MILEKALIELKNTKSTRDVLEILWIKFRCDYLSFDYYNYKIKNLPSGDYFISDLDWTFFRWTLQKEAVTLFIKFVWKQDYLNLDLDDYHDFLKDAKFFNELEKKAFNKEIEYFEYLNAWIYLLLRHKHLVKWDDYLNYIKQNFKKKEKINPFRFSISKMKEVLLLWKNFIFLSWAPDFIFEIYLSLLKKYIVKYIWLEYENKIFWFWSHLLLDTDEYSPLWGREYKKWFIDILVEKWVLKNIEWWMWDTVSDFWISYSLWKWDDFYFVNPEKKVIDKFDEFKKNNVNYHLIIERKDLIIKIQKEDIKFI